MALAIAIAVLAPRVANAAPPPPPPAATYCHITSDGTDATKTPANATWMPNGLNVHDVTLDGTDASDCYGMMEGNLPEATGFNFDGTVYTLVAKSNDATKGSVIGGIDFGVTATGVNSGSWTLTWADVNGANPYNLPTYFDLVVGLKAGNYNAAYLFEDVLLSIAGSEDGTFEISFRNFQGNVNGLSHLNVYAVHEDNRTPPTPPTSVPEPASVGLIALALLGLAATRRRVPLR